MHCKQLFRIIIYVDLKIIFITYTHRVPDISKLYDICMIGHQYVVFYIFFNYSNMVPDRYLIYWILTCVILTGEISLLHKSKSTNNIYFYLYYILIHIYFIFIYIIYKTTFKIYYSTLSLNT